MLFTSFLYRSHPFSRGLKFGKRDTTSRHEYDAVRHPIYTRRYKLPCCAPLDFTVFLRFCSINFSFINDLVFFSLADTTTQLPPIFIYARVYRLRFHLFISKRSTKYKENSCVVSAGCVSFLYICKASAYHTKAAFLSQWYVPNRGSGTSWLQSYNCRQDSCPAGSCRSIRTIFPHC